MKKTVGENLKMFRIKKGLSMEEAGKKIGVSAPAILKYERNKIIASLERLEEFAKIYDTTIDEILNIDASINIKYDNIFFKEKASNAAGNSAEFKFSIEIEASFGITLLPSSVFWVFPQPASRIIDAARAAIKIFFIIFQSPFLCIFRPFLGLHNIRRFWKPFSFKKILFYYIIF